MEHQKPNSIKIIGLIVSIFSGFILFSNIMGIVVWMIISPEGGFYLGQTSDVDPVNFIFEHYTEVGLIMILIGITYLIGGLHLRKYKLWANKLVTIFSGLLILIIWGLMIVMSIEALQEGQAIFIFAAILTALFWSTPLGLLIWFLNRTKNKKHFA